MHFHDHEIHLMRQTSCFHFPVAADPTLDSTIPHSYPRSFPLFSPEAGNKTLINLPVAVAAREGTRALLWKLVPITVPIPVTSPVQGRRRRRRSNAPSLCPEVCELNFQRSVSPPSPSPCHPAQDPRPCRLEASQGSLGGARASSLEMVWGTCNRGCILSLPSSGQ